jgi:hypothetical protein
VAVQNVPCVPVAREPADHSTNGRNDRAEFPKAKTQANDADLLSFNFGASFRGVSATVHRSSERQPLESYNQVAKLSI